MSVLVLLASLSSGCLAFAPHGSHLVGLRRAVGPAAGPSGRAALPALPLAGQRMVGASRGRAFRSRQGRRMEMALGLFKGKRMPVGAGYVRTCLMHASWAGTDWAS